MRVFALLLLASIILPACDSGADATLRLDGTYTGTGQSELSMGADPTPVTLAVGVDFDDATPGAIAAVSRVEVTMQGALPELYAGSLTGSLDDDGGLSVSGTLTDGPGRTLSFSGTGTATASTITLSVSGSFPISSLTLRRQGG